MEIDGNSIVNGPSVRHDGLNCNGLKDNDSIQAPGSINSKSQPNSEINSLRHKHLTTSNQNSGVIF